MALELGPQKINVNAVAPGAINSPMLYSKHEVGVQNQDVVNNNVASIPIGSIAEPSEVARAIKFLATQRHISGTILSVDGGYLAQ
jgi:NAD(P)-dependent dehydrogenase (short-subunit alcohol dehydrogenase family)